MRCKICQEDFDDDKVIRDACVDCRWAVKYINGKWPHPYPLDNEQIAQVKDIRSMLQNEAEVYVSMRIAAVFTIKLFETALNAMEPPGGEN